MVFVLCLTAVVALSMMGVDSVGDFSILVAIYSVAAHRGFRVAITAAVALEAGVLLASFRFAPAGSIDDAVAFMTGLSVGALFLGTTLRSQRRYLASIEDRARRLELEQAQQAELAAGAERARIAREMHDIVAHGLAVVITLAEGAAATTRSNPDGARDAMEQVAASGRQSLTEMRKLLSVLRTDVGVERSPQPSIATLHALIDDVRRTGLEVRLSEAFGRDELGPTLQATLYRIVQESLTNILKHAPGARTVSVDLGSDAERVTFRIEDDGGHAGAARPSDPSLGNGITGMLERVGLFGGTLEAGPIVSGWQVRGELLVH
jgi:signal transduction histidine kinase